MSLLEYRSLINHIDRRMMDGKGTVRLVLMSLSTITTISVYRLIVTLILRWWLGMPGMLILIGYILRFGKKITTDLFVYWLEFLLVYGHY